MQNLQMTKSLGKSKTEARDLVTNFKALALDIKNITYIPIWGRDVRIITDILKDIDKENLIQLMKLYFKLDESEYCIPYFKVRLNRLISERKLTTLRLKKMDNPYTARFECLK